MAADTICSFRKYGHCRYGETCRYRHVNENCESESCNAAFCEKRHPKECRFWNQFKRCKFGTYCSFKHSDNITGDEVETYRLLLI